VAQLCIAAWGVSLLVACGGAGAPAVRHGLGAVPARGWHYTVTMSKDLELATSRVCVGTEETVPPFLRAGVKHAARFARRATHLSADGTAHDLPLPDGGEVPLANVQPGDCIEIEIAVGDAAGSFRPLVVSRNGSWLVSTSMLFWGPSAGREVFSGTVRFELPPGVHVSAPFPVLDGVYQAGPDLHRFVGAVGFSKIAALEWETSGVTVTLQRVGGALRTTDEDLRAWISSGIAAVAGEGSFPVERLLVLAVPVPAAKEAVAFGQVVRGGGAAVSLFVHEEATGAELMTDWVLVHELSHLLTPFSDDAWLSEGLATYYQEVLRARSGATDAVGAWRALDAGFARGEARGMEESLETESRRMHATHNYARVYWMGAALAFEMDVALRKRGGNLGSLDALLAEFRRTHDMGRPWAARALIREWDRMLGEPVLVPLCERGMVSREFPDLSDRYEELGLVRDRAGKLRLSDRAPHAAIREAITAGATAPRTR
jgi:hypothetical protein